MKKVISTIVAIGFISGMLVNSAYAGHGHYEAFNPLWFPVAILSTVAATVSAIVQAPFVHERQGYSEPRQSVIYEEPRQYRHDRYYERGPVDRYNYEREPAYDAPRYRDYR